MSSTKSKKQTAVAEKDRRKAEDDRKQLLVRVRVTAEQKRIFTAAAEQAGLDLSSWLRAIGMERARALGVK